eukprot:GEMP01074319.1.p1 GENE.GEMP01074319.1~~GEMP01074319.1.p1  ORF type:complete len:130 (+),score=20.01 GEMP01074319.1:216-605(+)
MVECVEPESARVFGIGIGFFTYLSLCVLTIAVALWYSCSCANSRVICLLFLNIFFILGTIILPKKPCEEEEPMPEDVIRKYGPSVVVNLVAISVCTTVAIAGFCQFLRKPIYAVPRDERTAGHTSAEFR